MRDIVSKHGTFFTGLSALPAIKTTQTSPSVDTSGYNGASIYILAGTWTDGTHTFAVQESPDNSTWTNVATTDLILWTATSPTNFTPVRVGNSQPLAISSAATAINQRVGYMGNVNSTNAMRYLRVVTTVTGSPATGAQYDIIINLGEPYLMPSNV